MQSPETLTLVCLISVDPNLFAKGVTISSLPDKLDDAVMTVSPGLAPTHYYLVPDQVMDLRRAVNRMSVPYHKFAVEVCGDKCVLPGCEDHVNLAQVVPLFRNR